MAIVWSSVILAPLVNFPAPSALVGHPWKVELTFSFILCISLAYYLFAPQKNNFAALFSSKLILFVVIPCCALILWSAISAFWAGSQLSVLHHTLVWVGYLVFFLLIIQAVSDRRLFKSGIISLSAVAVIIGVCNISEYAFASGNVGETFGFRYSRYAEIFAALLPLFFAFVLLSKGKNLVWAIFTTLVLWLGILFTMSRGALLASLLGLFVFVSLRVVSQKTAFEKKRLVFAAAGIIFIFFLTQIPALKATSADGSVLARFVIKEEENSGSSVSKNVRFLFAGVGLEMFADNYLVGVGADNYGLEFNKYRATFSAKPENKSVAEMQEWLLAERTHNEYLQILTELGIVGGAIFLFFIFGIAKLSFNEIKINRFKRSNILTHAALAGIIAFLTSSFFSSFSFRLMQNGLVFFFLLAILLRNYGIKNLQQNREVFIIPCRLRSALTVIALVACFSLAVFSASKATSQYFVYAAERQENLAIAETYFQKAIFFDPANASANYLYGLRLLGEGFYPESAVQLQGATKKGINTSVSYSYLITAQILSNQNALALQTASEAVEIFPYSAFMRVRYASLLNKLDRKAEAARQYEIAFRLNEQQAKTWSLLINEGALKASQAARAGGEFTDLMNLKPEAAVTAVITEREILHPDEKVKFNF